MNRQAVYEEIRTFFSRPSAQLSHGVETTEYVKPACYYRYDPSRPATPHYPEAPLRCGIGCAFPDHLYKRGMEGASVELLIKEWPDIANHFGVNSSSDPSAPDIHWLIQVQNFHDAANTVSEFLDRLDEFALETGLTIPKPGFRQQLRAYIERKLRIQR